MGKLSSYVYKIQFEKCQKLLKLWDMGEYIAKDITDYHAQASSIFSKVKTLFNDNDLKLPKSTSIEIRGQNKKKEYHYRSLWYLSQIWSNPILSHFIASYFNLWLISFQS